MPKRPESNGKCGLKERIDIDFAATNPTRFAAGAPVSLDLDVKNVRSLIVKVFKINERNFYQQQGREVNTDTVYGCQVVITNPTSSPQNLDVLTQIPAGSERTSNA